MLTRARSRTEGNTSGRVAKKDPQLTETAISNHGLHPETTRMWAMILYT